MLESIKLAYYQAMEALAEDGVRNVFRPQVYWNRLATPVVMEISTSNLPLTAHLHNTNFQFTEITMKDLKARKLSFLIPSRRLKALRNLKRGFRGFAIIEGSTVVGDIWCRTPRNAGKRILHPDLEMLGIICDKGDAYAFDMFIAPAYRGKNLSLLLQKSLLAMIKMEGCQKAYGYYWDDNLPALWVHRMLQYEELPKRRISRFFFLIKSNVAGSTRST